MRLFTSWGGTVVLEGEYLSSVRPAKIDLSLEGVRVGVLDVGPGHDKLRTFPPLELDLPAGNSTLLMRSNKDGVKPAGDVRVLNFLVANLRAKRKDSQMVCEAPR